MSNPEWENSERLKPLLDFRKAIMEIDALCLANLESENEQDLFDTLVLLHAIKSDIGVIFSQYSALFADKVSRTEGTASNGQVIEKKVASERKGWKHDDLANEVLRRLNEMSVDMDTGEVVMSSQEIAIKLLDYVQPSYWRVKELSKLGINADQYCEVGELKTSVIVRKAQ